MDFGFQICGVGAVTDGRTLFLAAAYLCVWFCAGVLYVRGLGLRVDFFNQADFFNQVGSLSVFVGARCCLRSACRRVLLLLLLRCCCAVWFEAVLGEEMAVDAFAAVLRRWR
jgi:hypothetical protein